ncbi:MAG: hemolysin family protein [Myxococcota bacterium]
MFALIAFLLVSIVFSFLCSVWEAVLLSTTPSFTQMKIQEGGELGKALQAFKENIDRPLAAILTLNTIAHTVGAIGVGAQATQLWGASIIGTVVVPVAMTLAILILSEIIPKTIGANYWQELAGFTVRSLRIIIFLLGPLVFISQIITKALKKNKSASVLSRADFGAMTELGSQQGVFDDGEANILRNLLRFKTIVAENVMTPRTVMIAADEDWTIRAFHDRHPDLRFSRIPVYKESADQITGYVLKDHVLKEIVEGNGDEALTSIRRQALAVQGDCPIPELFNHFTAKREHMAIVVDKFGGTAGIVTMEDVIETLLGLEILDEQDNTADMQRLARKQWEERARNIGLIQVGASEAPPAAESD